MAVVLVVMWLVTVEVTVLMTMVVTVAVVVVTLKHQTSMEGDTCKNKRFRSTTRLLRNCTICSFIILMSAAAVNESWIMSEH